MIVQKYSMKKSRYFHAGFGNIGAAVRFSLAATTSNSPFCH
jgi:hypothetical protein